MLPLFNRLGAQRRSLGVSALLWSASLSLVGCAGAVNGPWGRAMEQVAYVDGTLWIRTNSADELYFARKGEPAIRQHLKEYSVLDLHQTASGKLWVLTSDAQHSTPARLWEIQAGEPHPLDVGWAPQAEPEEVWGLSERAGQPLLLTAAALYFPGAGALTLRQSSFPNVGRFSFQTTSDGVAYLASFYGEFGGALARMDRASGELKAVRRSTRGILGGDPVTALVRDPESTHCLLASEGSKHMGVVRPGHLSRVCGDETQELDGPWNGQPARSTASEVLAAFEPDTSDQVMQERGGALQACLIDPESCPLLSTADSAASAAPQPGTILSLSSTRRGVWISTRSAIYYRGENGVEIYPPAEAAQGATLSITWAANFVVVGDGLIAATADTQPAKSDAEIPAHTCWAPIEQPARALCFEADRFFFNAEGAGNGGPSWHSSLISWKPSGSGELQALIPGAGSVTVAPRGDHLLLTLPGGNALRAAWLRRIDPDVPADAAALQRVRDAMAALPDVAVVCRQAAACADEADVGHEGEKRPARRDLTTCQAWLASRLGDCPALAAKR